MDLASLLPILLALGVGATPAHATTPTITITSLPAYGTSGTMLGVVTGVNFATHEVACYAYVEGDRWYTQPSLANPTAPIQPNGQFSMSVGGPNCSLFVAVLIPTGCALPVVSGVPQFPASACFLAVGQRERFIRLISFAGEIWGVKDAQSPVGPGSCYFSSSASDVWVDSLGRLHLTIRFSNGKWRSTEVVLLGSQRGYGTYSFTTKTDFRAQDVLATFGAFTYDVFGDDFANGLHPYREIDSEDSAWGQLMAATTSQFVVQHYSVPGNLLAYALPNLSVDPTVTRMIRWEPGSVRFVAALGTHSPCELPIPGAIVDSTYVHAPAQNHLVPAPSRERFRLNLWINHPWGQLPRGAQPVEVIVSDFQFTCRPGCSTTPYCTAVPNSTGAPARICSAGTTSLGANDFALVASGAPPGQIALYYYGSGATQSPFGNGLRCVGGGSVFRLGPTTTTDAQGSTRRRVDFTQPPAASGPGQITAGGTRYFQLLYRDPPAGGALFNLSDGLAVTFGP